jgi:Lar family restriction alleviation protein
MSDTSTAAWDFYAHDIEACPFCGRLDLEPWNHVGRDTPPGVEDPDDNHWVIWCKYCGAEGPSAASPQVAAEYWNDRD